MIDHPSSRSDKPFSLREHIMSCGVMRSRDVAAHITYATNLKTRFPRLILKRYRPFRRG